MMEKIPWYQSAIVRQQVIALLLAIASLTGLKAKLGDEFDIEKIVTVAFAAAAVLIPAWTIFTRLFKATPPITDKAATHEVKMQQQLANKQGGFVAKSMLGVLLALGAVGAGVSLPACETIGVPRAQTFNEKVAYAYVSVTTVREAAIVHVQHQMAEAAKETDPAVRRTKELAIAKDAENVQKQADLVRDAIESARSLKDLDFMAADARLQSALQILLALQAYLETH